MRVERSATANSLTPEALSLLAAMYLYNALGNKPHPANQEQVLQPQANALGNKPHSANPEQTLQNKMLSN